MVVQHNLTAMNSNRMLGITTKSQAKSTEKLSSGYKINRAADDAAGLSISEKMRKQIRGLSQASLNAEDGISAVQTAEGALNEVQDMLQRMNELAVKAANGTNSADDRGYIQDEIDQLVTEIDRVSRTTKFNETYLLNGDLKKATLQTDTSVTVAGVTKTLAAHTGVTQGDEFLLGTITESATKRSVASMSDAGGSSTLTPGDVPDNTAVGIYTYRNAVPPVYGLKDTLPSGSDLYVATAAGGKWIYTPVSAHSTYQVYDKLVASGYTPPNADATQAGNGAVAYVISATPLSEGTTLQGTVQTNVDNLVEIMGAKDAGWYAELATDPTANLKTVFAGAEPGDAITIVKTKELVNEAGITGTFGEDLSGYEAGDVVKAYATVSDDGVVGFSLTEPENPDPLVLSLHVGADSTADNKITISIDSMSAKSLNVKGLQVTSEEKATASIDVITAAIQKVSTQRSALGAIQNRLEHTIANLDNVVENTTAAESQIRDTDMATEMVRYSNNNILAQAGQAMLAQANQANQGVLSLLG